MRLSDGFREKLLQWRRRAPWRGRTEWGTDTGQPAANFLSAPLRGTRALAIGDPGQLTEKRGPWVIDCSAVVQLAPDPLRDR
jgi:hypothetical protein